MVYFDATILRISAVTIQPSALRICRKSRRKLRISQSRCAVTPALSHSHTDWSRHALNSMLVTRVTCPKLKFL